MAPETPCTHIPTAKTIGRPAVRPGARAPPWLAKPKLANVRPGCAPPNAAVDVGMGSEPWLAIQ